MKLNHVNIKFIKMQNHATINLFLGMCVHNTGNALIGPSMCSFNRHAEIDSTVCLKMFHFEEFDVFDG